MRLLTSLGKKQEACLDGRKKFPTSIFFLTTRGPPCSIQRQKIASLLYRYFVPPMLCLRRPFCSASRSRAFSTRATLVAACFGLALCLANRLAEASCGDYVYVGDGHAADRVHRGSREGMDAERESAPPGCHGPHCRRQPIPSAPSKPVVASSVAHQWLDWSAAIGERDERCGALISAALLDISNGHYGPLERPPRRLVASHG